MTLERFHHRWEAWERFNLGHGRPEPRGQFLEGAQDIGDSIATFTVPVLFYYTGV